MKIDLHRTKACVKSTLGELWVDGVWRCVTLEDKWRKDPNPLTPENEAKVQDETCIPAGTYDVIVNISPSLGKPYPRLLKVPGFSGILIHSGNNDIDTKGCILVGQKVLNDDWIQGGSVVFPKLLNDIQAAIAKGEKVSITITDDFLKEAPSVVE